MIDEETKKRLISYMKEAPDLPHSEHEPVRFDYYIKLYYHTYIKNGNTSATSQDKEIL